MTDVDDSHYHGLGIHRIMLHDDVRCEIYRQALEQNITPETTVLDVGAGSGILSLFAAKSGAKKVYAVERARVAATARLLVDINGFSDRIQVIESDLNSVNLPEKVDLIVSEWMGGFGIDENILPVVLLARDRWLKPGGRILPARVTAWMAPAHDADLQNEIEFWKRRPYGFDFTPVAEQTSSELSWCRHNITEETLIAEPKALWTTDLESCAVKDSEGPFEASVDFVAARDGEINVLAAWFYADFGNGIALSNAPDAPPTHWGRFVFPLSRVRRVNRGDAISVHFVCEPYGLNHSKNLWSVRIGAGDWEHREFSL